MKLDSCDYISKTDYFSTFYCIFILDNFMRCWHNGLPFSDDFLFYHNLHCYILQALTPILFSKCRQWNVASLWTLNWLENCDNLFDVHAELLIVPSAQDGSFFQYARTPVSAFWRSLSTILLRTRMDWLWFRSLPSSFSFETYSLLLLIICIDVLSAFGAAGFPMLVTSDSTRWNVRIPQSHLVRTVPLLPLEAAMGKRKYST